MREIVPHLQDMPVLCREAWDKQQEAFQNMSHANYFRFIDLEFLNEKGEKTDELMLTAGFGACENEEDYKREFRPASPLFMLPADDIRRFDALPSVKQSEHP